MNKQKTEIGDEPNEGFANSGWEKQTKNKNAEISSL